MTIPASAQIAALLASNRTNQFVDKNGLLTATGKAVLDSLLNFSQGTCRFIPCNASTTSNTITLTMLSTSPLVNGYYDFDTFRFVADATTSGNVSALVVTPQGSLSTLNVYKLNGSTRAGASDVTVNLQYDLTFVDSLNSGNGGLVLR